MPGLWSESIRLAWRNFSSRLSEGRKHVIRWFVEAALFFAVLYTHPWFGAIKDEAKLSLALTIAVCFAVVLEFFWELLAAPNFLYRAAKQRAEDSEKALERERDSRPQIVTEVVQIKTNSGISIHLRVYNKGASGRFSAQIEAGNSDDPAFFHTNRKQVYWINETQSPAINYGDRRDILVADINKNSSCEIFCRDADGTSDRKSMSFDRNPISCYPITITITTNPTARNGSQVLRYSLSVSWAISSDKKAALQVLLVDLDQDQWAHSHLPQL
jgi:hypothetical protein